MPREPDSLLVDRVKVYVLSNGTGAFTLGSAVRSYRGTEALRDGETYSYAVESGAQYEVGRGEYVASLGTLTRVPLRSSSGGDPVDFPTNSELAFTALASDLSVVSAYVDAALAVGFGTWAELQTFAPQMQMGDETFVSTADTGDHEDPASGLVVSNSGVYRKDTAYADPVWLRPVQAVEAAELAEAWAQSPAAPDPGDPTSRSAKTWANQVPALLETALAPLQSTQPVGRLTGTPGAGTDKLTNGTYVFADPLVGDENSAVLVGYNAYTAGAIALKRFSQAGAQIGADIPVSLPTGAYSLSVPIGGKKGELIGLFTGGVSGSNTDSRVTYTSGSGAAPHSFYWGATGNVTSVDTSVAPTTGPCLEIRLEVSYTAVTEERMADAEEAADTALIQSSALFDAFKVEKLAGVSSLAISSLALTNNTFAFTQDIPKGAAPRRVRVTNPQTTAGPIHVKQLVYSSSTNTYTQYGPDYTLTVQPGVNVIDVSEIMPTLSFPWRIGANNGAASSGDTANKRIAYSAVTGPEYVTAPGSGNVTSFVPGAPGTGARVQFGFDYEVVSVPTFSAQEATSLINEMARRRDVATLSNPRKNPAASGVTVTIGATSPSSPYAQVPTTVTTATALDALSVITGGWKAYSGNQVIPLGVTKSLGTTTGGGVGVAYQTVHRQIYITDAPLHYVRIMQATLLPFRVIVDGQYVAGTFTCTAINTQNFLAIDFAGVRKLRTIAIEIAGEGGSSSRSSFAGWMITPLDTLRKPTDGLTVAVFGDSITKAANATYPGDGYVNVFGDLTGVQNMVMSGLSGTGWMVRGATGTTASLLDRVTDITQGTYDVGVIRMGVNDYLNDGLPGDDGTTITAAAVGARVTQILTLIRTAKPTTPFVIYGPFRKSDSNALAPAYEAAIKSAVETFNNPYFLFVPTISGTPPLFTGTGASGDLTNNGNSQLYLSTDHLHPTTVGHNFVADDMTTSLFMALQTIKTAIEA